MTLQPGQSVNFNVTFAPRASGTRTGVISLTGSASLSAPSHVRRRSRSAATAAGVNETASISLSGVGAQVASTGTTLGALTAAPSHPQFWIAASRKHGDRALGVDQLGHGQRHP